MDYEVQGTVGGDRAALYLDCGGGWVTAFVRTPSWWLPVHVN